MEEGRGTRDEKKLRRAEAEKVRATRKEKGRILNVKYSAGNNKRKVKGERLKGKGEGRWTMDEGRWTRDEGRGAKVKG